MEGPVEPWPRVPSRARFQMKYAAPMVRRVLLAAVVLGTFGLFAGFAGLFGLGFHPDSLTRLLS